MRYHLSVRRLLRIIFHATAILSLALCILLTTTELQSRREMESFLRNLGPNAMMHSHYSEIHFLGFKIPVSRAIAITAALPAIWLAAFLVRFLSRLRRKSPGLCPICSYDLRATPNRCPECGTIPAKANT